MDNFELYKHFYTKELATKTELNNAVNLPILLLTTIVSFHVYLFSKVDSIILLLIVIITIINTVPLLCCLYYLNKSYFNLGKKFKYAETNNMDQIYKYQKTLEEKEVTEQFKPYMEKQFSVCATINYELNRQRTEDLASAKRSLFFLIIGSLVASLIYITSLIIKHI